MKFISLFTKAPGHKRFSYEPRYYDPKDEERKEREERIKREIAREQGESDVSGDYHSRIAGSFQSARRRSNSSQEALRTNLIRLGVLLFLSVFIIAFLTWGRWALYSLVVFVPVYFYFKFKKPK